MIEKYLILNEDDYIKHLNACKSVYGMGVDVESPEDKPISYPCVLVERTICHDDLDLGVYYDCHITFVYQDDFKQ